MATVLEAASRRHFGELLRGEIPASALLAMCFNRMTLEPPPEPGYDAGVKRFMDGLSEQPCEFAVEETEKRIVFKGGFELTGANYDLVRALLESFRAGKATGSEIAFIRQDRLAAILKINTQSMRQQVRRLRKDISERLSIDLGIVLGTDDFIENRPNEGYRLSQAARGEDQLLAEQHRPVCRRAMHREHVLCQMTPTMVALSTDAPFPAP